MAPRSMCPWLDARQIAGSRASAVWGRSRAWYVVPVKASVRKATGIEVDDLVGVRLTVDLQEG